MGLNLSRRRFVSGALALPLAACSGTNARPAVVSAAAGRDREQLLIGLDQDGRCVFERPVSFRGHDFLFTPDGSGGVLIGRRPSPWLQRVYFDDAQKDRLVRTASGRHCYGHALFSPDGQTLLTTENDFERGEGVIVIRDAQSLAPLDEWHSGGIGPHQMAWSPDGRSLIIANGGLKTHPDYPRKKLNRDAFESSLSFLDGRSGALIADLPCPVPLASMRHLSVAGDGRVLVGMQYEGHPAETVPVLALCGLDGELRILEAPASVWQAMRQYVATVCVEPTGGLAVATCPRGHQLTVWDIDRGTAINQMRLRDTAGVSWDAQRKGFLVSSGAGYFGLLPPQALTPGGRLGPGLMRHPGIRWDNHLAVG